MGCASSKRIEATVDVYRPPPTSFAVFDINSIEEPWLKSGNNKLEEDELDQDEPEKLPKVPQQLQKLNSSIDDAPRSWDEVSKALENIKPTLQNPAPPKSPKKPLLALMPPPPPAEGGGGSPKRKVPRKSFSFHTLEELESNMSKKTNELKKTESMRTNDEENKKLQKITNNTVKNESQIMFHNELEAHQRTQSHEGYKPVKSVKENPFLLRDKMEREKEGKVPTFIKFNPLSDYPEKCPPHGEDSLVVYTTTLGGVRRTFENCNKMRLILESHRVVFDERDVALHGEFRQELKELLGDEEDASVPRLFVKGRYIGGVEEVVNLNETSRLGRILNWARVERGVGRLGCEGCGGARFVPCFDCGGSCKVVNGDVKERCLKCNENGLIHCPICN